MQIEEKHTKTHHVHVEFPFDVRATGRAIRWLILGFCLGVAVHNLVGVMHC
ncbi:hypothetical protein RAS2_09950 [Phycisphaerae bacterium RAS2]|nr:hypothetical protein RAS2_09950 [Phycisphaerae bacterium RAS2]